MTMRTTRFAWSKRRRDERRVAAALSRCAECIVALHTAYPAMAAEIRTLRSEARGLADDLRSLRADIMAVAAGGAVRWTKHAMGKAGLVPERRTIDNTPCTCGEANTQEKGRHDEDCPSVGL